MFGHRSFLERAASGDLPAVSWIDPNFIDLTFGPAGSNDDHPPSDLHAGQKLVLELFDAVVQGPAWEKTLLIITYDEHGGFYDHVPPPTAEDDTPALRKLGPRVPAFVISPWVAERQVAKTVFDHTSIIKTILARFCRKAGRHRSGHGRPRPRRRNTSADSSAKNEPAPHPHAPTTSLSSTKHATGAKQSPPTTSCQPQKESSPKPHISPTSKKTSSLHAKPYSASAELRRRSPHSNRHPRASIRESNTQSTCQLD